MLKTRIITAAVLVGLLLVVLLWLPPWATKIAMTVVVLGFRKQMEMRNDDLFLFCEMFSGGMLCLLADFYGLAWLGMWRGLTSKVHHRAIGATLAQIMTLPV